MTFLSKSGPIERFPTIWRANWDLEMFPHELISTCLDSLRELWIGWWWLRQALPVCHGTSIRHEFLERRQARNTGRRSLWFRIVSRRCQGIGENSCKILLSTIFQLLRTCSSGSSPPLCDKSWLILTTCSFLYIMLKYILLSRSASLTELGKNM